MGERGYTRGRYGGTGITRGRYGGTRIHQRLYSRLPPPGHTALLFQWQCFCATLMVGHTTALGNLVVDHWIGKVP